MNTIKLTFFFLFLFASTGLRAQLTYERVVAEVDKTETEEAPRPAPFSAATFPGGQQQLLVKLTNAVTYPELAQEYAVEGTVVILLKLDRLGKVTERKVIKGLGFGCDEAALAALDSLPDWNPARAEGKLVASSVYVPLKFRLR
ncbi:energy transducer TonB [Neolewinella persica]|uniref:energy transducer TonB n=1 Tax=Neolewinella persica TaxID=70998 RepID=UPI00036BF637|nr:energy transducer TonB [Neolewinella persica]